VSGGVMDSKSIGSKGEEWFKSCKKKHNTMIGSFQDSHQPDKVNFFMPWQSNYINTSGCTWPSATVKSPISNMDFNQG
jgi:hypothetical protein